MNKTDQLIISGFLAHMQLLRYEPKEERFIKRRIDATMQGLSSNGKDTLRRLLHQTAAHLIAG